MKENHEERKKIGEDKIAKVHEINHLFTTLHLPSVNVIVIKYEQET
jgi:hypothetical protein